MSLSLKVEGHNLTISTEMWKGKDGQHTYLLTGLGEHDLGDGAVVAQEDLV